MTRMLSAIRTNTLYGILVLIPVAAFALVAYYVYGIWKSALLPLADKFQLSSIESQLLAVGVALLFLLVVCFVMGTIVRTRLGAWTYEMFEKRVLNHLPGYGVVATLLRGFADKTEAYQPAVVTLMPNSAAVLGFVMEDAGGTHLTVVVPSAPLMTIGQIYLVQRSDVRLLTGTTIDAANCISQWGVGLQDYVSAVPAPTTTPPQS
jgi:uncharacterized membrane protein